MTTTDPTADLIPEVPAWLNIDALVTDEQRQAVRLACVELRSYLAGGELFDMLARVHRALAGLSHLDVDGSDVWADVWRFTGGAAIADMLAVLDAWVAYADQDEPRHAEAMLRRYSERLGLPVPHEAGEGAS